MITEWNGEAFKRRIEDLIRSKLDDIAKAMVDDAKRRCPVSTGKLRDSIKAVIDYEQMRIHVIATDYKALWVEKGTASSRPHAFLVPMLLHSATILKRELK